RRRHESMLRQNRGKWEHESEGLWRASTVLRPRIGTMNHAESASPALRAPSPSSGGEGWGEGVRFMGSFDLQDWTRIGATDPRRLVAQSVQSATPLGRLESRPNPRLENLCQKSGLTYSCCS